jgi:CRISPR-associated protein Cmr5
MSAIVTRQQKMAEVAYGAVIARKGTKEYTSFAKSFPALIHAAGLCQAVAFAQSKGKGGKPPSQVLEDVFAVFKAVSNARYSGLEEFVAHVRTKPVTEYLRLSRLSLLAATWVKRYVEAVE